MPAVISNSLNQYLRIIFAVALLILEILLISLLVDAKSIPQSELIHKLLSHSGDFIRWVIVTAAIFTLGLLTKHPVKFLSSSKEYSWALSTSAVFVHIIVFLVFTNITIKVFKGTGQYPILLSTLWVALSILAGITWCCIIDRLGSWINFLRAQKNLILISVSGGFVTLLFALFFQRFWVLMSNFTLTTIKFSLQLLYQDVIVDEDTRQIGLESFSVFVDSSCSGIEGMVLAISTACFYLYLAQNLYKFPRAIIIVFLACIASLVLNIVRITSLIIIGVEYSADFAIGGFHSVAGWFTSVLVSFLVVFVFSSIKWFQKPTTIIGNSDSKQDIKLAEAILIPFIVLTISTLIGKLIFNDFDYIYPAKMIIVLSIIILYWKTYNLRQPEVIWDSLLIGGIVAAVWIILIPTNSDADQLIANSLNLMPQSALLLWGIMRLLGFLILAPILEELVFRGYLISRLSSQEINNNIKPQFSLFALLVTSVLFGLLHSEWLAGILSGLLFAFARYRSNTISTCIYAHITANAMVAVYAIYTARYSLI